MSKTIREGRQRDGRTFARSQYTPYSSYGSRKISTEFIFVHLSALLRIIFTAKTIFHCRLICLTLSLPLYISLCSAHLMASLLYALTCTPVTWQLPPAPSPSLLLAPSRSLFCLHWHVSKTLFALVSLHSSSPLDLGQGGVLCGPPHWLPYLTPVEHENAI